MWLSSWVNSVTSMFNMLEVYCISIHECCRHHMNAAATMCKHHCRGTGTGPADLASAGPKLQKLFI